MMRVYSFPPIADKKAKVLILGTLPGGDSLDEKQYYANKRNSFWKLMCDLLEESYAGNYSAKCQLLLDNSIAIWDVLHSGVRKDSLDKNITDEEPNDIGSFLKKHPSVRAIFFNGQKAATFFNQYVGDVGIQTYLLPSTSPANTSKTYEEKRKDWEKILAYIDSDK